jgi:hypothetical protein
LAEPTLEPFVLIHPVLIVVILFGEDIPEDGLQSGSEYARIKMRLLVMRRRMVGREGVMMMGWRSRGEGGFGSMSDEDGGGVGRA